MTGGPGGRKGEREGQRKTALPQVRVRQVGFRWQSRSFGAWRSGSMAVGPSWTRERHSGTRRAREGPTAFRRRGPTWWGNRRCRRRRRSLKLGTKRGEIELAHRRSPHALPPSSLFFSVFLMFPALLAKGETKNSLNEEDGGRHERVRSSLWKVPRLLHLSFRRRKLQLKRG